MPEELFPGLFRELIPIPRNPLRAVNSYVIRGGGRFLVIDTGMNRPKCREAMERYLKELQVDLSRADFFITHFHADHLGLVSEFFQPSSRIYMSTVDDRSFRDPEHWNGMAAVARMNGFPEADIREAIDRHPGFRYHARHDFTTTFVREGDTVEIGDYRLTCIETPGHTRGHLCLYEPRKKMLFSGDHILETITPNISLWAENEDPLRSYLQSLDKVYRYDVDHVLPGHREPFPHFRTRIDELKQHHDVRSSEILSILRDGRKTAYETASYMTWDIDCKKWEDFPLPQQWFAAGEALAHLQYLQGRGKVKRELRGGKAFFINVKVRGA
ncbi:MAG: MBL fold metallo-hydrolase [Chitinispirillaceae bacterium]|nr:MBL fold metallo-hydrolase [Chitinispirillaceae bacterium]